MLYLKEIQKKQTNIDVYKRQVNIECDFLSEKAPSVEFEFKAMGNAVTIGR